MSASTTRAAALDDGGYAVTFPMPQLSLRATLSYSATTCPAFRDEIAEKAQPASMSQAERVR